MDSTGYLYPRIADDKNMFRFSNAHDTDIANALNPIREKAIKLSNDNFDTELKQPEVSFC